MAMSNEARPIVPRGRIWKKNRLFVLERDGRTCYRCGKKGLAGRDAHVDHIKPLALGGEDELWNYAASCALCNKVKSDRFEPVDEAFYNQRKAEATSGRNTTAIGRLPSLRIEDRPSSQTQIPIADVEKMFAAYRVGGTANYVAQQCGVSGPTAQKYVLHGDPSRGIEPFRERLIRIQASTAARNDERAIESGTKLAGHVEKLLAAAIRKIAQFDDFGNIVDLNVTPDFRDIVELGRFLQVLQGGADHRTEHAHKFSNMSDDELRRLVAEKRARLESRGVVIDVESVNAPALPAAEFDAEEF